MCPSFKTASVPVTSQIWYQYVGMVTIRKKKKVATISIPLSSTQQLERGTSRMSKNHLER
ncbi:hypothetical protein DPMN_086079 [Dreissena polymorpha]|uniref:Uncharacterized protein n=1 Tax=Dreissena polymorpha TaxID=45954 RepID=A0A9D3YH88_DREPO|nr:hypothetical protein DPMN_086079 [Dreissena polymorpha]